MKLKMWLSTIVIFLIFWKSAHAEESNVTEIFEVINIGEKWFVENVESRVADKDIGITDETEDYVRIFIIEDMQFRTSISNRDRLWENGVVPYEISNRYSRRDRNIIMEAMKDFRNKTCIRFKPRRNERSYVLIMPGAGCSAGVGKGSAVNRLSLGNNCLIKGIVLHELMHALGFFHEQNRPDRDQFVRIVFSNIKPGAEINFEKNSPDSVLTFNQSYDYGSVMHYGELDFARNTSRPTIVPLQDGVKIGQRVGFSDKDVLKINLLYNCSESNNTEIAESTTEEDIDEEVRKEQERNKRRGAFLKWFFGF